MAMGHQKEDMILDCVFNGEKCSVRYICNGSTSLPLIRNDYIFLDPLHTKSPSSDNHVGTYLVVNYSKLFCDAICVHQIKFQMLFAFKYCSNFTHILHHEFGNCFVFNSHWNDDDTLTIHKSGSLYGNIYLHISS